MPTILDVTTYTNSCATVASDGNTVVINNDCTVMGSGIYGFWINRGIYNTSPDNHATEFWL